MRVLTIAAFLAVLDFGASPTLAVERGRGGEGRAQHMQSPGGAWGERSHQGGSGQRNYGQRSGVQGRETHGQGANEFTSRPADNSYRAGTSSNFENRSAGEARPDSNQLQHPGAAGAAAAERNQPQYSGKKGAAAGAAVADRNQPQFSGAQGAAAGAAVANRNQPQYSGAQGAIAGAAVTNRNQPQLSGAQGAALGAAAVNANSPQMSGAQGAAVGAVAARSSFNNYGLYNSQWLGQNAGAWSANRWAAGNAWTPANWQNVASYYGTNATPVPYDYGDNVTYENGNIVMNGQNVGTAEQFSQQAADLADTGASKEPDADSDWLPLGVFAMVRNEQQHPHLIMQLAINRQGMLRGNYTDDITESTQPIKGAIDPKSQRAAWVVGDHKSLVMEAGLSNLTEGNAPALIHKNGKTDHWLLVRLDQPSSNSDASSTAPPAQ